MNLEERVERLENFVGDIDKIVSVYANSVQEICDKYLNILYIEEPIQSRPDLLVVNGFLTELDEVEDLPKNVVFNIRASHDFKFSQSSSASKIRFSRYNEQTQETIILEIALKKYNKETGNLVFLDEGDYIAGTVYNIYINSQGIAIISSNDSGTLALQKIEQTNAALTTLADAVNNFATTFSTASLSSSTATISSLNLSSLNITNPFILPTGSTCSSPTSNNHVANKRYVDAAISSAIQEYHNNYHLFGTADASQALANAPERAIYYKY